MKRRSFLAMLAAPAATPQIGIGVMDGTLGMVANPAATQAAAKLGFTNIQVTLGKPVNGRMPLSDPAVQQQWRAASADSHIRISATYINVLHDDCLKDKTNAQSVAWVEEGIRITKALGAPKLMLVFFGKCATLETPEQDAVIDRLKPLCRQAEAAGITLALENTIPADADLRILDQVKSPALKVWYDIGNATNQYNVEPAKEIRRLGKELICEFHIKDKVWIGEGKVDLTAAARAIKDIGYSGVTTLETSAPTGDRLADAAKQRLIWADTLRREGVAVS